MTVLLTRCMEYLIIQIFEHLGPTAVLQEPAWARADPLATDKTSIQIVRESEATTTNRLFVYGIHEFLPQNFSCSRPTAVPPGGGAAMTARTSAI